MEINPSNAAGFLVSKGGNSNNNHNISKIGITTLRIEGLKFNDSQSFSFANSYAVINLVNNINNRDIFPYSLRGINILDGNTVCRTQGRFR